MRCLLVLLVGRVARDVAGAQLRFAELFARRCASSRTAIGRGDERPDDVALGLLDSPRQRDLALARQERDTRPSFR